MTSRVTETLDQISRSGEAAFAIDPGDRIVLWNKECEALLGYPAQKVLGKRCYEVMGGRDANGNVYCYRNCPVAHQARMNEDDPVNRFPLFVKNAAGEKKKLVISLFAIPSLRPELSTVVHIVREEETEPTAIERRLAKEMTIAPSPRWPLKGVEKPSEELTVREKEILRCLAEGLPTPAIAKRLFISPVTVRNHVQNILQKLDVHTKLAAVVFAYRHELI
jgi:PAS domain S-box-containing protein